MTWFTHLLRFCSTSKEISKHWPGPPRSQWRTAESLFSCPKFLVRPRVREPLRGGQGWEWWRNWCTGRHSGPSPVSVLPPFSPHCTVSAGPPTTACALAKPGCSSSSSSLRCVRSPRWPGALTAPCGFWRSWWSESVSLDKDGNPADKNRINERTPPNPHQRPPRAWAGGREEKQRSWKGFGCLCVKVFKTITHGEKRQVRSDTVG